MKWTTCTFLALIVFPLQAAALSVEEIAARWGSVSNIQGTFTETYTDGSVGSGSFYVQNASAMRLSYKNGAKVTIASGKIRIEDPHGETAVHNLGAFRNLFSTNPNLGSIVTGSGENRQVTTVRIADPQGRISGYVDVTFDNRSGRIVRWRNRTNGENITTNFNY